jgi:hypothetical protein
VPSVVGTSRGRAQERRRRLVAGVLVVMLVLGIAAVLISTLTG